MKSAVVVSLIALLLVAAASAQVTAQIELRPPDGMDAREWKQLLKQYDGQTAKLAYFLDTLEKNRFDPTVDSMLDRTRKIAATRGIVDAEFNAAIATLHSSNYVCDYGSFLYATTPRLTGRVVHVLEGTNLIHALKAAEAGDTLLLAPGVHKLGQNADSLVNDLALVGDPDGTVLRVEGTGMAGTRILLENMRINCNDNEFIYPRQGGTFHVRNCTITHYNSGAGGSNAVGGSETVMLFEDCTFDGGPGRAQGRSNGDAFDLRGTNLLYVRNCTFSRNDEIIRATFPCVFDRCKSKDSTGHGIMPYPGGSVYLRRNRLPVHSRDNVFTFTRQTDSMAFIKIAAQPNPSTDSLARQISAFRNLHYWIGLMAHRTPEVRDAARERLKALTGHIFAAVPTSELGNVHHLLTFAIAAEWLEDNKPDLVWDANTGRYTLSL